MGQTPTIRSTTILAIRRDGQVAIGGDGQVTIGNTAVKHDTNKIRRLCGGKILVGFAAETGGLDRAGSKLRAKRVDLLVANDVTEAGSGFGTPTNRVTLFAADGHVDPLPLLPKRIVADRILDRVAALLDARDAAAQTGATFAPGRSTS